MIRVKDGFGKLIGTTAAGSAGRVLLSNGGDSEFLRSKTYINNTGEVDYYKKITITNSSTEGFVIWIHSRQQHYLLNSGANAMSTPMNVFWELGTNYNNSTTSRVINIKAVATASSAKVVLYALVKAYTYIQIVSPGEINIKDSTKEDYDAITSSTSGWIACKTANWSDTNNTAGSTNSTSKMYLIGATTQGSSTQTYSNNKVYATDGVLYADSLRIGYDSTRNYIAFNGTTGDDAGSYNHTYVGENYTGASELSELVLFKGNDPSNGSGPDRIRHIAGRHLFQVYTSALSGSFETICTSTVPVNCLVLNATDITTYNPILPSTTNAINLGSSTLKWANVYATNFKGTADNTTLFDNSSKDKFFIDRGAVDISYVDLTDTSAGNANYKNLNPGMYEISRSGYSELMLSFAINRHSCSSLEFKTNYNHSDRIYVRKTIDSNRISGQWQPLAWKSDIPTKTSQLTNDSGFLTQHQILANYVTLNTEQTITESKTFSKLVTFSATPGIIVTRNSGVPYFRFGKNANTVYGAIGADENGNVCVFNDVKGQGWDPVLSSRNYTNWVNTNNFPGLDKTGTVTSITLTAGAGIGINNSETAITTSGTRTITNTGVRSTTINGNYLRVNTNGTNADLTIPYANSAGELSSRFSFGGSQNKDKYFYVGSITLRSAWAGYHSIWSFTGGEASWGGLLYLGFRASSNTKAFAGVNLEWLSLTDQTFNNSIHLTYTDTTETVDEVVKDVRICRIYIKLPSDYKSTYVNVLFESADLTYSKSIVTAYEGTLYGTSTGNKSTYSTNATNVIVNQHTGNNIEYPLVWSNSTSASTTTANQLYKSYNHLTYNPNKQRVTASLFKGNLEGGYINLTTPAGSIPISVTTNTSGQYQGFARLMASGLEEGNSVAITLGRTYDRYNCGYIGFLYNGNDSTNNAVTIGSYGKDYILNVLGSGNVGIGTKFPRQALEVLGNIQICSSAVNKTPKLVLYEYYNGSNDWVSELISDYHGTNVCTTSGFTHGTFLKLGRQTFDNFIILNSSKTPIARISKEKGHWFDGDVTATNFIGSLTGSATHIKSSGRLTAETTTNRESGLRFYRIFENGYPFGYGNVIQVNGNNGVGQLAMQWYGTGLAYRSAPDTSTTFTDWATILTNKNSEVTGGGSNWGDSITIKLNGVSKTLTIPSNPDTDTKVTQNVTTRNDNYPLLLAPYGQTANTTGQAYFDSEVTLNPSTNILDKAKVYESLLQWGGYNVAGDVSPIDAAMSSEFAQNRLAFLNPDLITIEFTRDNGANWYTYPKTYTDAGTTDIVTTGYEFITNDQKQRLVTDGLYHTLWLGSRRGNQKSSDKLRITILGDGVGLYIKCKKILFRYCQAYGNGSYCLVEAAMANAPNTFNTIKQYNISGWTNWNSIPYIGVLGESTSGSRASNTRKLRLTFGVTGITENSTTDIYINKLRIFGTDSYAGGNSLTKTGHLYTFDVNKNAAFPANVTATTFIGSLSGTATNATNVNIATSSVNDNFPLLFTTNVTAGNKRVYTDSANELKYNPSTNTLTTSKFVGDLAGNLTLKSLSLCSATESDEIKIVENANDVITTNPTNAGGFSSIRKALDFRWYDSHWQIGNIRSGSSSSDGFGVTYGNDNLRFRVTTTDCFVGADKILHAGNYTNYTVTKTGTGANGTWGINITGNAATATSLVSTDSRSIEDTPTTYNKGLYAAFKYNGINAMSDGGSFYGLLHFRPYGSNTNFSGGYPHQLAFTANQNIWYRKAKNATEWNTWKQLAFLSDLSSYAKLADLPKSLPLTPILTYDNISPIGAYAYENANGDASTNGFLFSNTSAAFGWGKSNCQVVLAARAGQSTPTIFIKQYYQSWGDWQLLVHSGNVNDYAPKWDGTNARGTWNISISGKASGITGYTFKTLSAKSHSGWTNNTTDDKIIPTMSMLAFWNGAHTSSGASNLTYCTKGAFGDAAVKGVTTSVTSGDTNLVTSGGVYSYINAYLPLTGGTLTGNLNFNSQIPITWTGGTYQQRINTIDDAVTGTDVFQFQQSSDSGTNWKTLLSIRDEGTVNLTGGNIPDLSAYWQSPAIIQSGSLNQITDTSGGSPIAYTQISGNNRYTVFDKTITVGQNNKLFINFKLLNLTLSLISGYATASADEWSIRLTPTYYIYLNGTLYKTISNRGYILETNINNNNPVSIQIKISYPQLSTGSVFQLPNNVSYYKALNNLSVQLNGSIWVGYEECANSNVYNQAVSIVNKEGFLICDTAKTNITYSNSDMFFIKRGSKCFKITNDGVQLSSDEGISWKQLQLQN